MSVENNTLLHWFDEIHEFMQEGKFAPWGNVLKDQLQEILHDKEHGDQERWLEALESLPAIKPDTCNLSVSDLALTKTDVSAEEKQKVEEGLRGLMPWRKGPFRFFDTYVDTEWHSDWKWDRVAPHLAPLKGRTVLDVGCGSGYHMWRMLGGGADRVVGVDPSRLFLMQFQAMKRYAEKALGPLKADLLPLKMEDVPARLQSFDTTFSMGVLYHRKSPIDHIQELRDTLRPGGQLVLETLVIEGKLGEVLMPEDRYAMMRNVWFLPSVETLLLWCRRAGLRNPRVVDLNQTSIEEQRTTDWMRFNSLPDFLDADNHDLTAEGYPAPLRAVILAEAP